MFKTNQLKETMTKIRIFHKAFENEIKHVATMKMPTNKNIDETLEYVFKRTQNLNETWINDSIGFDMIPTVETRSTCVGDIIETQLAPAEGNKIRGAYNHAEYLPERKKMMQDWSNYLDKLQNKTSVSPSENQQSLF